MAIDLITVGAAADAAPRDWPHGRSSVAVDTPRDVASAVAGRRPNTALLVLDERLDLPDDGLLRRLLEGPADAWHGGIALGLDGAPPMLDHVNPTWMFNAAVDPTKETTSWRASLRALLVRAEVLDQCGPVDGTFDTLAGASLDLGLRWILAGAVVRHVPALAGTTSVRDRWPTEADGARIVRRHRSRGWSAWALLRSAATGRIGWAAAARLLPVAAAEGPGPTADYQGPPLPPGPTDRRVSVILPTVDRYPYLVPLLGQLAGQRVPAHEVVVVDQTPADHRRHDLATVAPELPLIVLDQDEPGQCTARNAALFAATGDAFLFIDDDDEIADDLIEQHLLRLSPGIDGSCGGVDDATAGPPPPGFRSRRASDVFPTNNVLVTREALERSGLFDPSYDRGPRADHDVGMRLHLAGATLIYDPTVRVFHHHAPAGGLRTHRARTVTRASARRSLTMRHLPATTELYLRRRYYDARQVQESLLLNLLGQWGGSGSMLHRLLRAAVQAVLLPSSRRTARTNDAVALTMLAHRPPIPTLPHHHDASGTARSGPSEVLR